MSAIIIFFYRFHFPIAERDVVDRIMANLINQNRNRRQIIKKMKEMGLIINAKELAKTKQSVKIRPPKEWADHELVELRRIFEEVRHSSGSPWHLIKENKSSILEAVS